MVRAGFYQFKLFTRYNFLNKYIRFLHKKIEKGPLLRFFNFSIFDFTIFQLHNLLTLVQVEQPVRVQVLQLVLLQLLLVPAPL